MNRGSLIRASLRHYRRLHVGVVGAAIVATAALVGALVVGDCLEASLRRIALQRLGQTHFALQTHDRLFRQALADDLAAAVDADRAQTTIAPLLARRATASTPTASAPIGGVQLLGVDRRFWQIGDTSIDLADDEAAVNRALADKLHLDVGGTLIVRFDKPAALPADAALADAEDRQAALRLTVAAIVADEALGRFNLQQTQHRVLNVFVDLDVLADRVDEPDRANVLLIGGGRERPSGDLDDWQEALDQTWRLPDIGWDVEALSGDRGWQVSSRHVFLDESAGRALIERFEGRGVLTYLANALRVGERSIPYAMVAAMAEPWFGEPVAGRAIWLNAWAASEDDLDAALGEALTLRYFDTAARGGLVEREAEFKVARIVPMSGRFVDRELMPPFPGLAEAEHQADWDGGDAIDVSRIRPRDEAYWDRYRGSPKAFIPLSTGRELWANRFGAFTAIRFDAGRFDSAQAAADAIRSELDPARFGLQLQPVRAGALAATQQGPARYFGGLFVGLSFFLIAAAALLTAMVFVFSVEQRRPQVGLFLAVGFTAKQVRRLLWAEGGLLAAGGVVLGVAAGLAYAWALLWGLRTVWSEAIGSTPLVFAVQPSSMIVGAAVAWVTAAAAIGLAVRQATRREPAALLSGASETTPGRPSKGRAMLVWFLAVGCIGGAGAIMALSVNASAEMQAGGFIGAGTLVLIGLLAIVRQWLKAMAHRRGTALRWSAMAWRGVARRRGRSVAVVALLAAGLFLTLAIGANRRSTPADPFVRHGPTGGYNLMIDLTRPLPTRPSGVEAARPFGAEADVLALRLSRGTEATCGNLNRPSQPLLAGVDPAKLAAANAFAFAATAEGAGAESDASPWSLLEADLGEDVIPAIADQPTIVWALGLGVGDELTYTDESGDSFRVRLVGMLEPSVLQGRLLVDDDRLLERYPSLSGYGQLLVRTRSPGIVGEDLRREWQDRGVVVTPTLEQLERFFALENAYLSIFMMLGGLALALGSVGVGVVVLRQVSERRGELALLRAVGFSRGRLTWGLIVEHAGLGGLGLLVGVAATALAVWPPLRSGLAVPWLELAVAVAAIAASLFVWVMLAAWVALRGSLLDALREE